MDKFKILSGKALVDQGVTQLRGVLPELGLKDVVPDGSWLEQKQVQSALEARKQLIQVERIEKSGSVSHAKWHEDLMLVEVTQKAGGHWQYIGHNVGKQLFLYPEEALFLMETNALLLTYNEVTVSLQQAYSLLLRSKMSLTQYKVYASLSRVGYKVFRHEVNKKEPQKNIQLPNNDGIEIKDGEKIVDEDCSMEVSSNNLDSNKRESSPNADPKPDGVNDDTSGNGNRESMEVENIEKKSNTDVDDELMDEEGSKTPEVSTSTDTNTNTNYGDSNQNIDMNSKDVETVIVDSTCESSDENACETVTKETVDDANNIVVPTLTKLDKLRGRQVKPSNPKEVEKHFRTVPDFYQKQVVTIGVPKEEYIPKNVFLNNVTYVLNVESIRTKKKNNESPNNSREQHQVNGANIRRFRDQQEPVSRPPNFHNNSTNFHNNWLPPRFNRPYPPQRPFNHPFMGRFRQPFLRPHDLNRFHWNFFMNYMPRYVINRPMRPPLLPTPNYHRNVNTNFNSASNETYDPSPQSARKRSRNSFKKVHMEAIKKLADRLKHIIQSGVNQAGNVTALNRLIETYNTRYRTNLTLSEDFELRDGETIIDMIELDDDDEETVRKRRKESFDATYNDNLHVIKELTATLKELEAKGQATPRHRRVLSGLIKRFNKSYDADICIKNNEVVDKRLITLDSSSESDCVVEEPKKRVKTGKKLKNPFNILKRLSEKSKKLANITNKTAEVMTTTNSTMPASNGESIASTSQINDDTNVDTNDVDCSGDIPNVFGKWLPPEDDFGTATVPSKDSIYNFVLDVRKDEYMFDFIRNNPRDYENWIDLKICYLEAVENVQSQIYMIKPVPMEMDECNIKPIIDTDECTDTATTLKKLSIIKTFTDAGYETSLKIDFDVYHRDVQNFRKTSRPKPHFYVICMSESSRFPSGRDVAALHSSHDDDVSILFAAVGVGSVSFLQINPSDLPVYVPQQELS